MDDDKVGRATDFVVLLILCILMFYAVYMAGLWLRRIEFCEEICSKSQKGLKTEFKVECSEHNFMSAGCRICDCIPYYKVDVRNLFRKK